jgi:hypothetical protein
MNRCVAIHANGTSEVLDVQPRVHRELRGLGYRRFVIRTADGRSPLTAAVYARIAPSPWQISDAARRLWGRNTTDVHVFDEHGEPLVHDGRAAMTTGEMRVIDAPVTEEHPVVLLPPSEEPLPDPIVAPPSPAAAVPALLPDVVTRAMVEDLRRAARELRGLIASRPVSLAEATDLRALADRVEAHARTLEALLTR